MPKVHHVKKAAKDNAVCKKGESYYYWEFRYGGKRMSKTYPRPSQLTLSKMSEALAASETLEDTVTAQRLEGSAWLTAEDITAALDEAAEAIRSVAEEYRDSLSNMPEGLQQGQTGQEMEEKADNLDSWADDMDAASSEVEGVDLGDYYNAENHDGKEVPDDLTEDMLTDDERADYLGELVEKVENVCGCPF